MANSIAGSSSTAGPGGVTEANDDSSSSERRGPMQKENERLREELSRAHGIIDRQNRELETLRRTIIDAAAPGTAPTSRHRTNKTVDPPAGGVDNYDAFGSSSSSSSSFMGSSVPASEQTSGSVIFIEGRIIPQIHAASSDRTSHSVAEPNGPPLSPTRLRHHEVDHAPPPSAIIQFAHERDDESALSFLAAPVLRRLSSLTMADTTAATTCSRSPLLVHGIKIPSEERDECDETIIDASVHPVVLASTTTSAPATSVLAATTNGHTSGSKAKKRLVRQPTPLPSARERNFRLQEEEEDDHASGDKVASKSHTTTTGTATASRAEPSGQEFTVVSPHLFCVKEDSSAHGNRPDVECPLGGPDSAHKTTNYKKENKIRTPVPQRVEPQHEHYARTDSEVTAKASNTTADAVDTVLQGERRKHQDAFVTRSPLPPSNKGLKRGEFSRDAPGLAPPKRIDSPLPKSIATTKAAPGGSPAANSDIVGANRPAARTIEVVDRSLRDAWNEPGLYTGSIDSTTLLPDGFGTMIYSRHNGQEYTGDWEQGQYHGHGKHTNADGEMYDGPFAKGIKEGKDDGTMTFRDGRRFHGRFHADKMREGVLQFLDGSSYEGLLENDKRNGFGLYCFSNGDEYEGQWRNDKMHGRGRMEWKAEGTTYNGDWEGGIQHGIGTEADLHGKIIHQGRFHQGKTVVTAEPV